MKATKGTQEEHIEHQRTAIEKTGNTTDNQGRPQKTKPTKEPSYDKTLRKATENPKWARPQGGWATLARREGASPSEWDCGAPQERESLWGRDRHVVDVNMYPQCN